MNQIAAASEKQNGIQILSETDNPIQTIAKMAMSGVPIEILDQMKSLIEWDDARRAEALFNAAFSAAKKNFKEAKKSGYNSHLNTHYSLLEDYDEATRESLSNNGLAWRHIPEIRDNMVYVTCVLAHEAGHRETATLFSSASCLINKAINELQSMGAVVAYLKRITLSSMLGLVSDSEENQDGNGGHPGQPRPQNGTSKQPTQTARSAKSTYSDQKFKELLPQWQKLINEGKKTAEQIIAMVSSKVELTAGQAASIRNLENQKQTNQPDQSKSTDEWVADYEKQEVSNANSQ